VTFADMGGKFSKLRTYLIVTGLKMTPTIWDYMISNY
jgi:hypothetical protein